MQPDAGSVLMTAIEPFVDIVGYDLRSLDALPDGTVLVHSLDLGTGDRVAVLGPDGTERFVITDVPQTTLGITSSLAKLTSDGGVFIAGAVPKVDNELDYDLRFETYDPTGMRTYRGSVDLPLSETVLDVSRTEDGRFVVLGTRTTQEDRSVIEDYVLIDFDVETHEGPPLLWDPAEGADEPVTLYALAAYGNTAVVVGEYGFSFNRQGAFLQVLVDGVPSTRTFSAMDGGQSREVTFKATFASNGELYTAGSYNDTRAIVTKYNTDLAPVWRLPIETEESYGRVIGGANVTGLAATTKGAVFRGGFLPEAVTQVDALGVGVWQNTVYAAGTNHPWGKAAVTIDDDTVLLGSDAAVARVSLIWPTPALQPTGQGCESDAQCASAYCCKPPGPAALGVCREDKCDFLDSCEDDARCASGLCSTDFQQTPSYCSSACTSDSECGEMSECVAVGAVSACVRACITNDECTAIFGGEWHCATQPDVQQVEVTVCLPQAPPDGGL
jgi:hypothetical protein